MGIDIYPIVLLFHILATFFMAAPFYMLIVVNERARFGIPPGYNTDRYMENIIKNQPPRCYAFMAVIFATGLSLIQIKGFGWSSVFTYYPLTIKVVAFFVLLVLLSYIHFKLQTQIEKVIDEGGKNITFPEELRPRLMQLRIKRKKFAALCLFLVLTMIIMGLEAARELGVVTVVILLLLAAIFALRAFKVPVPYGWF